MQPHRSIGIIPMFHRNGRGLDNFGPRTFHRWPEAFQDPPRPRAFPAGFRHAGFGPFSILHRSHLFTEYCPADSAMTVTRPTRMYAHARVCGQSLLAPHYPALTSAIYLKSKLSGASSSGSGFLPPFPAVRLFWLLLFSFAFFSLAAVVSFSSIPWTKTQPVCFLVVNPLCFLQHSPQAATVCCPSC